MRYINSIENVGDNKNHSCLKINQFKLKFITKFLPLSVSEVLI